MHRGWSLACAAALVACAHHTDAKDAIAQLAPIACQREAACLPILYDLEFPDDQNDGSTKQCVNDAESKADPNAVESCDDDQFHKCLDDLQTWCAPADNLKALPPSCSGC